MIHIEVTEPKFPAEEMERIGQVYRSAIHAAFDGQVLDPRALAGSLLAGALAVLKESGIDTPKIVAKIILDGLEVEKIVPFSNHQLCSSSKH